jgi:putative hydrolase of the HAD superfamily
MRRTGGGLALRAVVFDFGMVLTGLPDAHAHAQLERLTGLSGAELEKYYWVDRHAYDEGKLTGFAFWQRLCAHAGLKRSADEIEELNQWDARMWTTQDPAMVKWHAQLKARGLKTAVLSNMGDSVHASIMRAFPWLKDFDVLVWSYELGYAKPDPRIYLHTLAELGTQAAETLFVDDKAANVEAAQALGIEGLVYSTMEKMKAELVARGLEGELPLPG